MSIHQRFKAALQALGIAPDVKAALALSGGPDSLALAILAPAHGSRKVMVPCTWHCSLCLRCTKQADE